MDFTIAIHQKSLQGGIAATACIVKQLGVMSHIETLSIRRANYLSVRIAVPAIHRVTPGTLLTPSPWVHPVTHPDGPRLEVGERSGIISFWHSAARVRKVTLHTPAIACIVAEGDNCTRFRWMLGTEVPR
jgi:hypothetical protein